MIDLDDRLCVCVCLCVVRKKVCVELILENTGQFFQHIPPAEEKQHQNHISKFGGFLVQIVNIHDKHRLYKINKL